MASSRLSAAATSATSMIESGTKMTFGAIDCADGVPPEPQLPWSRFIKGVLPQPNGRWGAQTCERRTEKCIGTSPDEETAACSYDDDVAAPARCCHQAITDFSVECATDGEPALQATTSIKSEAVGMLQMHTPADEVTRPSLWPQAAAACAQPATTTWAREHLFQKALTPSDVGKLNRLVVPKQHAEKHLFDLRRSPEVAAGIGMLIDFKDGGSGKTWRFRYSFSATSRIYVITKGWRRFVREKGLRAGDTVAFSRSAFGSYKQIHIDCWKKTQKKMDDGVTDAITVDCRAVMLFGVDISRS